MCWSSHWKQQTQVFLCSTAAIDPTRTCRLHCCSLSLCLILIPFNFMCFVCAEIQIFFSSYDESLCVNLASPLILCCTQGNLVAIKHVNKKRIELTRQVLMELKHVSVPKRIPLQEMFYYCVSKGITESAACDSQLLFLYKKKRDKNGEAICVSVL